MSECLTYNQFIDGLSFIAFILVALGIIIVVRVEKLRAQLK
jgi:hypothetical protein